MPDLLTPKQVARAIDVSESSVKRWCDKGSINATYTDGGHRKIALADFVAFIRGGKHELVRPEALGLPATSGQSMRVVSRACGLLCKALLRGDELACQQVACDLFLANHSMSVICDDLISATMRRIGDLWECGDAEVFQERQACEIVSRVVHELRNLLPTADAESPLAIGCAAPNDPYTIGSETTELVLRASGWRTVLLGGNLPFETISAAIKSHRPKLFWLGCSHIGDEATFVEGYMQLFEEHGSQTAFVVGGKALSDSVRRKIKYAAYCDNMQHVEEFASTLHSALSPEK